MIAIRRFSFPAVFALSAALSLAAQQPEKIVGLYVHQHWPYHHPYAARTWTLADWRGFAGDLRTLGYNTILLWPVIETIPNPPTPSDLDSLEKHRQVIRMLHQDLRMRVVVALCPNVEPSDSEAAQATFEQRHFFYSDRRVNPADKAAVAELIARRTPLLQYFKEADGFAIIDSDPGGYPGSTDHEFVDLLAAHRKLFDRLRPGIELLYWMHAGWAGYSRFYATAEFHPSTDAEFTETLRLLDKANLAPWGIATARRDLVVKAGLSERMIALNYGRIESEPSFPRTNFGGDRAYEGGKDTGPRGVIGNAQTHCVQLPNIFAFARGAKGQTLTDSDYREFAARLIPGQGALLVRAWQALAGDNSQAMLTVAAELEALPPRSRTIGEYKGLLFSSADRFLRDLVLQLRFTASARDLIGARGNRQPFGDKLGAFVEAATLWQRQHGYENRWYWPELRQATEGLSPELARAWAPESDAKGFEKVRREYAIKETMTPRILDALRNAWQHMPADLRR